MKTFDFLPNAKTHPIKERRVIWEQSGDRVVCCPYTKEVKDGPPLFIHETSHIDSLSNLNWTPKHIMNDSNEFIYKILQTLSKKQPKVKKGKT